MCAKTKELTVEIPEYLYEESLKLTSLGLFRDLSDLVAAGMRRELQEAKGFAGVRTRGLEGRIS